MKSNNLDSLRSVIDDMTEKYNQLKSYSIFSEQAQQALLEMEGWIIKLIGINNSEQENEGY